jgi:PAS domain-containing protein
MAVGRPVTALLAAAPALAKDAARALAGAETMTVATLGEIVIEVRHAPLRDAAGAIVGAVGIALDVTARERAEERLRAVLGHAPVALFALDPRGTVTLSTGRGLAALHRPPGETPVGRSIFELYRDTPAILDHARRALDGEAFTARATVGDATYETHYLPLRGADGALAGVLGVGTDITARARAEAALRRREARLSATEEELLPLLARADLATYRQVGAPLALGPERVRDLVKSIAAKLGVEGERDVVIATIYERELL